jgi:hypothetical protein
MFSQRAVRLGRLWSWRSLLPRILRISQVGYQQEANRADLLLGDCMPALRLTLWPWRWRQHFPRNGVTYRKIVLFIVTSVRASVTTEATSRCLHFIWSVLQCYTSPFGRQWGTALFWFSLLCCRTCIYFHRFALFAGVRFQNVFCSKSHLNYSWLPNLKRSWYWSPNYAPVLR